MFSNILYDNKTMIELPEKYKNEIRELLGDEYDAYIASFNTPSFHGLRVNTNKISVEDFLKQFPYELEPIPWTTDGFYYQEADPVSKHPYYYAGLYYIQEPSAMLPAETLPIEPYDKVLDVCAAPGGKSTKLAVKLHDTGVLFANDISVSRSQALLKNIERFGVKNAFVMAEDSNKFKTHFPQYFDKILIDAPCSGEGMFRKENSLIKSWVERDSDYYVPIQKEIVKNCLEMLKDGGSIVYSTCTFSPKEDEEVIQYALSLEPSLHVIPLTMHEGFTQNAYGTKLFPHRIKGEGHFVTLLQKGEQQTKQIHPIETDYNVFPVKMKLWNGNETVMNEKHYFIPDCGADTKGLRILRSGLLLGEDKKGRFEFDGALAMAMKESEAENVINLSMNDERVLRYLKGETLDISDQNVKDGYALVCVDHQPLGFAKITNHVFKNKYPKGWIYH